MEAVHGATGYPAELVESCREEILSEFESALRSAGNAVFADQDVREQALRTARHVLDDVAATLRAGKVQIGELYQFQAREIGNARAAGGVHPKASLEAGSLFFRSAVRHLTRRIAAEYESPADAIALAIGGMEESLSQRVRESAEGYHGFLLNQVQEAQEDERRRIARELHDRIGHGVSVAHQQLALSEAYRPVDAARASAKIGLVQQAIQETMENLRQITTELHPQIPVRSLEKSLIGFIETVEDDEVSVRLDVSGDESWAWPRVLDETFLIVREALRNALGHGRPKNVLVRVNIAPHELSALVQDNGSGFDPAETREHGGVGLTSMRERAELLGGRVLISSEAGSGCLVELFVPLKRRAGGQRDD